MMITRTVDRNTCCGKGEKMKLWIVVLVALTFLGCGYGKATCQVIDVAHTACEMLPIEYLDKDGNVQVEYVPVEEIHWAIRRAKARRGVDE